MTVASAVLRTCTDAPGPWRRLNRLAAWCARCSGWKRAGLAFALGALAVLALPPVYLVPMLIPAFTGLSWLLDGSRTWRSALGTGFMFGLGYLSAGLYWVANALLTKPDQFGWVAPIAPVALAAILAPYPAVACVLTRLARRPGVGRVLTFAAAWTLMEWVRSWAFTGFPWNLIGSVWAFSDAMLQPTAVIGTYGLSLLTVTAAMMPAVLAHSYPQVGTPAAPLVAPPAWRRWRPVLAAFAVLAALYGWGAVRLESIGDVGTVEGPHLRLVQGNIAQTLKWRRDLLDAHLLAQARLGSEPGEVAPTHVIWSEAAAPLFLANDEERLKTIGAHTPPGGLTILGTLRTPPAQAPFQVWNSMLAIDARGHVVDWYDKSHLVPFGEYMPLRSILGLNSVAGGSTDFSHGEGVRTLHLPGLPPVGALICYEIIFPGEVVDRRDPPQWLLNLTNDGWYGQSAGPYQHLVAARLRAVEEGLPVVRVANTGISAVIDPLGRVITSLGLGERGTIEASLPRPLPDTTLFAQTGVIGPLGLALAFGAIGVWLARRK